MGETHTYQKAARADAAWDGWMTAAQDGDRQAYRCLLVAITPYVRAIASRMAINPMEIEDAVQDVLIAVHVARAGYDPARPFRPWLAGLARHRLIDRARAGRRRAAHEVPFTSAHDRAAPAAEAADPALPRAIGLLSPVQRLAIERLKLREQSLRAVSAETGVSIGALKVATHRGIRRLRALLVGEQTA